MAITPFVSKPNFLGVSNSDMNLEENGALKNISLTSPSVDTTKDTSGGIISQAGTTADAIKQAEAIANTLYGDKTGSEPDWGVASLLYFSKLAEESSKPGATFAGSMGSAFTTPAAYLMEKEKQAQAKDTKKASLVAGLVPSLLKTDNSASKNYVIQPNQAQIVNKTFGTNLKDGEKISLNQSQFGKLPVGTVTGFTETKTGTSKTYKIVGNIDKVNEILKPPVAIEKNGLIELTQDQFKLLPTGSAISSKEDKTPTVKSVSSGQIATYMTETDAKEFLTQYGVDENSPLYETYIKKLTSPNEDLIGEPLIEGGSYIEIFPLYENNKLKMLQFSPSKTASKPDFTIFKNKRMENLAKTRDTYLSNITDTIPRIQQAMDTLISKSGPDTGGLTAFTLPFKKIINQTMGTVDPELMKLESLQSISVYLATKMRPVGSGSTSDMEFKAYQRSALTLENTTQSNYISLYALKKMKENSMILNDKETELLTSGKVRNFTQLNKKLKEVDTGIFKKYTGDPTDEAAVAEWYNSLADGDVFINNGLYNVDDVYIIKGWRKE